MTIPTELLIFIVGIIIALIGVIYRFHTNKINELEQKIDSKFNDVHKEIALQEKELLQKIHDLEIQSAEFGSVYVTRTEYLALHNKKQA